MRMAVAMETGAYVIIQPTFPTIPEKYQPRLTNLNERRGLNDIFGLAAAAWQQQNHHHHEVFQVGSLERLMTVARSYKENAKEHDVPITRLMISKHGALVPWTTFFPDSCEPVESGRFHVRGIFNALNLSMGRQPYKNLIPALAPVLRVGMSTIDPPHGKPLKPQHLSTQSVRNVSIGGESVRLRDLLVVPDPQLRAKIEAAPSFSMVATPYLQRWSLAEGITSAREHRLDQNDPHDDVIKPVCMFHHIGSEKQLAFD